MDGIAEAGPPADAAVLADLACGSWIAEHRNVILAGPIGTGKTHLAIERVDVLVLDEVGVVPFDRAGGELLFNTISARRQRRSS